MSKDRSMEWVECIKVNAKATKVKERVVTELGLSIAINRRHFARAIITPTMKKEFSIGYLFSQGIIDNIADVESITVKEDLAEINQAKKENRVDWSPQIDSDLKVDREDIFNGVNAILKSKTYAETEAIHSAGLFKPGTEAICIAEDVGRHNALDKVIGYALINKIDLRNTFIASTGRITSDTISKICRAKIPIAATKTAVTKLGIEIGERHGLTIVGFVRDREKITTAKNVKIVNKRGMKIYTNPWRIVY